MNANKDTKDTSAQPPLGLPYARAIPGGVRCPVCRKAISEEHDDYGERTTNNYAQHYHEQHA